MCVLPPLLLLVTSVQRLDYSPVSQPVTRYPDTAMEETFLWSHNMLNITTKPASNFTPTDFYWHRVSSQGNHQYSQPLILYILWSSCLIDRQLLAPGDMLYSRVLENCDTKNLTCHHGWGWGTMFYGIVRYFVRKMSPKSNLWSPQRKYDPHTHFYLNICLGKEESLKKKISYGLGKNML